MVARPRNRSAQTTPPLPRGRCEEFAAGAHENLALLPSGLQETRGLIPHLGQVHRGPGWSGSGLDRNRCRGLRAGLVTDVNATVGGQAHESGGVSLTHGPDLPAITAAVTLRQHHHGLLSGKVRSGKRARG